MDNDILVDIIGDSGPFSRMGKSIGYRVLAGDAEYLIDCGGPVFQRIGGHGFGRIKGLFITHAHDDHKRWLTDMALFKRYAPDVEGRLTVIATDFVHRQLEEASRAAVCRSLSTDSRRVVDLPYDDFFEKIGIGPRARYHIELYVEENGKRIWRPRVLDEDGAPVEPSRAKVVIHPESGSVRMLFRDPGTGAWVEPENFYALGDGEFYHEDQRPHHDESGLVVEAVKSPVWHGLGGVGLRLTRGDTSVFITSDTVHDRELWKGLTRLEPKPRPPAGRAGFEGASVLYGDINDYIECVWSESRYAKALECFEDHVVIQDVAGGGSVVHTDYPTLASAGLDRGKMLLTHGPDVMVSEWVLCQVDKYYLVSGKDFHEVCGDRLYPCYADLYFKHYSNFFVGYRNEHGEYWVYRDQGLLRVSRGVEKGPGEFVCRVDLYQDIAGEYYPLPIAADQGYRVRNDGRVELVTHGPAGSTGRVVEGVREALLRARGMESERIEGLAARIAPAKMEGRRI